jgi:hypothetical protein
MELPYAGYRIRTTALPGRLQIKVLAAGRESDMDEGMMLDDG